MSVPAAYAAVVIIWSTTPLSIAWSNEAFHPVFAAFLRMSLAALVGIVLLKLLRIEFPWDGRAWRTYSAASMGIFGAVLCTYMAALYVPSGLIAVIYGFTPMVSGLAAHHILQEPALSLRKWMALGISAGGLALICLDEVGLSDGAGIGIVLLLMAVALFSLSGVLVKKNSQSIHPFAVTVGALWFSVPCYLVACFVSPNALPDVQVMTSEVAERSIMAIVYLAFMGSLLGFFAYHYILKALPAAVVALVTVITPLVALALGYLFNHETLALPAILGSLLVVGGLLLFVHRPRYTTGNT